MAKRMSQKQIRNRITELKIIKRNGMMRAVAAFVGMAVLIAVYVTFQAQGAEWTRTSFASLGLFMLAIVAAAIAGMGTRRWRKAKDEIASLESKLK